MANELGVVNTFNHDNGFIPEIYSKKLARETKRFTRFIERNTNREWEGEIRAYGDTVRISLPGADSVTVAITSGTTDVCPSPVGVTPTAKTLTINNIATFSLKFSDVEQVQSQFNLLDGYSALAMQKLGDAKDKQVMIALITAAGVNQVGSPATPQEVDASDIYDQLIDIRMTLAQQGAINGEGFYSFKGNSEEAEFLAPVLTVDPVVYGMMLKSTQLTHPTANADQVIERAQKSMMAGFEIDMNTVLSTITADELTAAGATEVLADGAHIAIAATKMAVTYANQYTKVEKLRDPDCFADIVRGLELYGFEVLHPECAVVAFLAKRA